MANKKAFLQQWATKSFITYLAHFIVFLFKAPSDSGMLGLQSRPYIVIEKHSLLLAIKAYRQYVKCLQFCHFGQDDPGPSFHIRILTTAKLYNSDRVMASLHWQKFY